LKERCLRASDRAQVAQFRALDGLRLSGAILGKGRVGVVLAHQAGGDLCEWMPFARSLARAGYRALVFDFRGYGSSAPAERNRYLDRDVAAAAAELRERGSTRIFLVGASMGGTAVLGSAPTIKPAVAGVIDLSAPEQFGGLDGLAAVRHISSPALFIAARRDQPYVSATRKLFAAALPRTKRLVIIRGSSHGVQLLGGSEGPLVRGYVLAFIRKHARIR
jgi:pimeloyl-ACP methyl ester carboxylesterase